MKRKRQLQQKEKGRDRESLLSAVARCSVCINAQIDFFSFKNIKLSDGDFSFFSLKEMEKITEIKCISLYICIYIYIIRNKMYIFFYI